MNTGKTDMQKQRTTSF